MKWLIVYLPDPGMNSAVCSPFAPNANGIDRRPSTKRSKYFLWTKRCKNKYKNSVHTKMWLDFSYSIKQYTRVEIVWHDMSCRIWRVNSKKKIVHPPMTKPTVTSSGKRILSQIPISFPFPATGSIRNESARLMQKPAPPVANQNLAVESLLFGFLRCSDDEAPREREKEKKNKHH